MTRLVWDRIDEREYEAGLDRGVFYPLNGPGHSWNGLVSVEESPSEADPSTRYFDGKKLPARNRRGEFAGTIQAYTYPTISSSGLVTPHRRSLFSLSYRVQTDRGYKIHLVYNVLATPSERNYRYESTDPFSWEFSTRGMPGPGGIIVSHLVIDSSEAYPETMTALEDVLYGNDAGSPRLPTPDEVFDIFEENSILQIIDHGDGTWTAIGPDDVITMLDPTTFQIDWPSAVMISVDSYTIESL